MVNDEAKVEGTEEAEKTERTLYPLDNDTEGSRAAYIRQEFEKGRTRREIADELAVTYNIVHSATANMDNGTVGQGGARIMVEMPDGKQIPRADYIRAQVEDGKSRGEVAKELDVAYGVVYAATKGMDIAGSHGGKVMVTNDEGEEVARVEFIRELYAEGEGMTRREIANKVGCDYSVVWTATRAPKEDEEEENAEEDNSDEE